MANGARISLKAARINADLTQEQAAKGVGVSITTIHLWETGERIPTVDKAFALAELYMVPLDRINFVRKVESK